MGIRSSHDTPEGLPEVLPARMINEFTYCPRLFHLEHVQGEWAESEDTVAGAQEHRRVDRASGELPDPQEVVGASGTVRAVTLTSQREGITAKLDVLELGDGCVVPVDYKHGRVPEGLTPPIWDADRIQLGVQALVLIDNGYPCREAVIYYVGSKRRVRIPVDDQLLGDVRRSVVDARRVAASPTPPPPLRESPKCPRCSLAGICLPDETHELVKGPSPTRVRLLYASRDDAQPLQIQSQGSRLGKSGNRLEITERDGTKHEARLIDVSQVGLFGNVQVTASAIGALMSRGTPICHFSYGGWFRGITQPIGAQNCRFRIPQFAKAASTGHCLRLSRGFVERKIRNCRTLLRRNTRTPASDALDALAEFAGKAARSSSLESLLGTEGAAARVYFSSFQGMLKDERDFDFTTRNRRPPSDPVNALLSLAYSVLSKDWTVALLSVGLDPYLGFLHQPRYGRASLALDLMEEFRPLVADSVVLQVINNGEIGPRDFLRRGPGVTLTPSGRKKFFIAYERRMNHLVRHPLFGYRVSYRRLFEVQSRLFARALTGELPSYDGFLTR